MSKHIMDNLNILLKKFQLGRIRNKLKILIYKIYVKLIKKLNPDGRDDIMNSLVSSIKDPDYLIRFVTNSLFIL